VAREACRHEPCSIAWRGESAYNRAECGVAHGRGGTPIDADSGGEPRLFTLEEAQALLPTIKALFARFNRARERATTVAEALEDLEGRRSRANILELARPLRARREELGVHMEEMRTVVRTAQALGIEIKRLDPALIDFRSERDGREIYLCWQEGEETISYWHELHSGFVGRRPL
jgi:hypothetical protein